MVNALKKMDKKFLVMAGLIICLPIVIIIFLAIVQGCGNKKITPEAYEKKMLLSAERYFENKSLEEGNLEIVELSKLVKEGYIKPAEELLEDSSCEGNVSVRKNGSSIETNDEGYLNYIVNLKCSNYKTITLNDKLKEYLVSEDSGLYQVGDEYIFRGNKLNNYITFYGQNYRIMGIAKDGILKLIKSEPEATSRIWDNKFNVETNRNTGQNIYKDSVILEHLLNDYNNSKKISLEAKKEIVSYDVCVGKRNSTNYAIDNLIDCSEKLENQVVSILNVSDYARASLDPNCVDLKSRSCNNYNYLYEVASSTWTLNASLDNTYDAIYISDGLMEVQNTNSYNEYNLVIYIDGNQKYTTGNGSVNNPFVIE